MSVPLQPSYPQSKLAPPQASYLSGITSLLSGFTDPISDQYNKLHQYRGLVPNPGNVEALGKDVKSEFGRRFS